MKILCVSDHKDPIVYSSNIRERFKDIDLVLGAGDLDLDYYGFIVSSLNTPLLFVFGNHNLKRISQYRKKYRSDFDIHTTDATAYKSFGSVYIGGKVVKKRGLIIAGLGGSRRYNSGPNQYSERQMYAQIFRMYPKLLWNKLFHGRYLDILVTHASPFGIGDRPDPCHIGFKAFLSFMRWFAPKYLIHGHIHLYDMNSQREHKYVDTRIINAYDHTIIDITEPS